MADPVHHLRDLVGRMRSVRVEHDPDLTFEPRLMLPPNPACDVPAVEVIVWTSGSWRSAPKASLRRRWSSSAGSRSETEPRRRSVRGRPRG